MRPATDQTKEFSCVKWILLHSLSSETHVVASKQAQSDTCAAHTGFDLNWSRCYLITNRNVYEARIFTLTLIPSHIHTFNTNSNVEEFFF